MFFKLILSYCEAYSIAFSYSPIAIKNFTKISHLLTSCNNSLAYYLLLQNENANKEKQKKTEDKALGSKMSKAQEVFFMANSSNDASDIHDMNSSVTKAIINERNTSILKHKDIDATKLPDTQREIASMNQEAFKNKLRNK